MQDADQTAGATALVPPRPNGVATCALPDPCEPSTDPTEASASAPAEPVGSEEKANPPTSVHALVPMHSGRDEASFMNCVLVTPLAGMRPQRPTSAPIGPMALHEGTTTRSNLRDPFMQDAEHSARAAACLPARPKSAPGVRGGDEELVNIDECEDHPTGQYEDHPLMKGVVIKGLDVMQRLEKIELKMIGKRSRAGICARLTSLERLTYPRLRCGSYLDREAPHDADGVLCRLGALERMLLAQDREEMLERVH